MEAKINIAEILADKPIGTKLYTDAFGELSIEDICTEDEQGITLLDEDRVGLFFYNDGRYSIFGEPILVPSKLMHDWSKFSWKKGDVLVNKDNVHIIFEKFEDDAYTRFKGKHYLWKECDEEDYSKEETKMLTSVFEKANDDAAQTYINTIEERLGGKLNLETLEIEKQPEFKDGDIITVKLNSGAEIICIFKADVEERYYFYAYIDRGMVINNDNSYCSKISCTPRLSTVAEKQQLFDALAKENKTWDAEKKAIVDLKPKVELKPFDKVLVRDRKTSHWGVDLFGFKTEGPNIVYHCMGGFWKFCIPYIGNESLLGTTKDAEK